MNHLDLFSGIGGFALAARWAKIKTVGFCEIDPICRKILAKHWPDVPIHSDIKTLKLYPSPYHEKIDLITAGFPCQPFSVAGKKKGDKDDRYLWPEVIRIARESRPTWLLLENVPGIIPVLDPILEDLEREGYSWRAFLISANACHAPHQRERLWIVAHSNSVRCDSRFDNPHWRYLQADWERYSQALQEKWTEFQPRSWKTFDFQEWFGFVTDTDSEQCDKGTEDKTSFTKRPQWSELGRKAIPNDPIFGWQKDQPPIPGVDDGLPFGVDRNRALGNAIVPQIPYLLMSVMKLFN